MKISMKRRLHYFFKFLPSIHSDVLLQQGRSRCPTGPVASVSLIWARPGADLFDGHLTMTRLLNCLSLRVPMQPAASRTNRQTSTQLAPSDRTLASFFNSPRVRSRVFHFIHSFSFAIYFGLSISSLLSRPKTALSQSLPLSSMLPRSTSRRGWNLEKREKVTTATIIEYASKCEVKKKMWHTFSFKSYKEVLVGLW
jgi:hypothetical protein